MCNSKNCVTLLVNFLPFCSPVNMNRISQCLFFLCLFLCFWLYWVFVAVQGLLTAVACLAAEHRLQACWPQWLLHGASPAVAGGPRAAAEHRLQACWPQWLLRGASPAVAGGPRAWTQRLCHGLRCSATCAVVLDQGPALCPLHWQADCCSLCRRESPQCLLKRK